MANTFNGRTPAQRDHVSAFKDRGADLTEAQAAKFGSVAIAPKATPPDRTWWQQPDRESFMRAYREQAARLKANSVGQLPRGGVE